MAISYRSVAGQPPKHVKKKFSHRLPFHTLSDDSLDAIVNLKNVSQFILFINSI